MEVYVASERWLLLQHLLHVEGGQFVPESPGQFAPELVVSLPRNQVVWFIRISTGTTEQLINYLTDFESEGYIVMINHLEKKNIAGDYQQQVEDPDTKFVSGSWFVHTFPSSNFSYYESKHHLGIEVKTIFHFILNVNF